MSDICCLFCLVDILIERKLLQMPILYERKTSIELIGMPSIPAGEFRRNLINTPGQIWGRSLGPSPDLLYNLTHY